jgi:hypothetical protein
VTSMVEQMSILFNHNSLTYYFAHVLLVLTAIAHEE